MKKSNDKRTTVPATVTRTSITTGQPMGSPVPLELQFLHEKGMVWMTVAYDSYSRDRNLMQDITVHGLPVDIPELRSHDKALYGQIEAAMANNAGTYYDDHQEEALLIERVQEGPKYAHIEVFDSTEQGPENLMEGVLNEIDRVLFVVGEYDKLPNNAGKLGAGIMRGFIARAKHAIGGGNVVELLYCYKLLKRCEPDMKEEDVDHE